MCGRYALSVTAAELIDYFQLISCPEFDGRYNIAPQSAIPIIRYKPGSGRVGQLVKWGLIPSWARDPSIGAKLNNARGETVQEKPSFRNSFIRHRCLIPATAFYEWHSVAGKKQPYCIRPAEPDNLFAFAGLLAAWKAPDGNTIVTTCIITTEPNEVMAPIHDRMPVILEPHRFDAWLDPAQPGQLDVLRPCSSVGMVAYPVRPLSGDGPACQEPL